MPRFVRGSGSSSRKDACINAKKITSGSELEYIEPSKSDEGNEYAPILNSELAESASK